MYQLKDMECWASQNADKMCIWYVTGISPEAFIWTHRLDGVEIYQHWQTNVHNCKHARHFKIYKFWKYINNTHGPCIILLIFQIFTLVISYLTLMLKFALALGTHSQSGNSSEEQFQLLNVTSIPKKWTVKSPVLQTCSKLFNLNLTIQGPPWTFSTLFIMKHVFLVSEWFTSYWNTSFVYCEKTIKARTKVHLLQKW